jgi:hypothetical protein
MRLLVCVVSFIVLPLSFQAQKVLRHKLSSCDRNSYPEFMKERIISKNVRNDTLMMTLGFSENCCISFRPAISRNGDTLSLFNKPKEPDSLGFVEEIVCMCDCCFELNLLIYPIRDTNFIFYFDNKPLHTSSEKYRTITPRFTVYNGDTINRINKYGHRQGVWRIYNQGTNALMKEIYFNEDFYEEGRFKWMKIYKSSGTLEKYVEIDPLTKQRKTYDYKEYKVLMKSRNNANSP